MNSIRHKFFLACALLTVSCLQSQQTAVNPAAKIVQLHHEKSAQTKSLWRYLGISETSDLAKFTFVATVIAVGWKWWYKSQKST